LPLFHEEIFDNDTQLLMSEKVSGNTKMHCPFITSHISFQSIASSQHQLGESMQKKVKPISVVAALYLLVVASCSLTNLNAVWKEPQYQGGKIQNVLVIGGSTNQVVRRIFEDEFTARLKTRGTNAIPSYSIFPSKKPWTRI
jgi:hypothetical protein